MKSLTPDENNKLKATLLYVIKKRHQTSKGLCGFRLLELQETLDELVAEGKIIPRQSHQSKLYTLNTNNNE